VHSEEEIRRALNVVAVVAVIDAVLLVPLVIAALSHAEGTVSLLGPLHGAGFIILIGLVLRGTIRGMWGWWFPVLAVLTLGPPGCLIGDLRIRRTLPRTGG